MRKCIIILVMGILSFLLHATLSSIAHGELVSLDHLSYDSQSHLAQSYLLFSGDCAPDVHNAWVKRHDESRIALLLSTQVTAEFTPPNASCFATCISRGVPRASVIYPLLSQIYDSSTSITSWLSACQRVEFGVASFIQNTTLQVYWIDATNTSTLMASVLSGERNSVWQTVYLGHTFEIRYSNGTLLNRVIIRFTTLLTFGTPPHRLGEVISPDTIQFSLMNEYNRSLKIKRTFTAAGFSTGRLPPAIWASIQTYYYNNAQQFVTEAWKDGGVFVNWWEVRPSLLLMPPHLSYTWQEQLRHLVEQWIGGDPLESTNIYGIRRYRDGARLLTHVDRHATHAVSLIINVGQGEMREPWHVEIYDFAGRLHEIPMEPGDIVYYESARCLHGRMKPLQGAYYDNLFSHYRPVGDPEWYLKVSLNQNHPNFESPYLRPGLAVHSAMDLFEYWKAVSRSSIHHMEF